MPDHASDTTDHISPRGTLTLIRGCMFSGKTTELLRRLAGHDAGTYALFKHVIDDRYATDAVVSHMGQVLPARKIALAREILATLDPDAAVIAIDEGHFFDEELVDVVRDLGDRGVTCIITALDRDSWANPFPLIDQIGDLADEDIMLHTTCAQCGEQANRTQRLTPVTDDNMVGGPESYEPRCATCWSPPVVLAATENWVGRANPD